MLIIAWNSVMIPSCPQKTFMKIFIRRSRKVIVKGRDFCFRCFWFGNVTSWQMIVLRWSANKMFHRKILQQMFSVKWLLLISSITLLVNRRICLSSLLPLSSDHIWLIWEVWYMQFDSRNWSQLSIYKQISWNLPNESSRGLITWHWIVHNFAAIYSGDFNLKSRVLFCAFKGDARFLLV